MRRHILLLFILVFSINSFGQATDSFKLYFPLNMRELSLHEQHKIDSLISKHFITSDQDLSILGYADYLANEEYNLKLSQDRADNVKNYLIHAGFKPEKVKVCIGKGKIERPPVNGKLGYPDDRKVVITIDKPVVKKSPPPLPPPPPAKPKIEELKVNETLVLDNIYFLPGRHIMRDGSLPELGKLLTIMKSHPTLKIRIEGHICCTSEGHSDGYDYDDLTWDLSTKRAKAVYDYLVDNGIGEDRLEYKGFSKTRPLINPEITEDDQNKNRRVEIRILEK